MSIEEPEVVSTQLAVRQERSSVLLMPVMDINTAMHRLREFQAFCDSYLEEGIENDYGVIPGTKKKTLLKPGADKLCEVYGLADDYEIITKTEDFTTGLFDYTLKCVLTSRKDDSIVGTGVGACSSYESKYRWRDARKKCPHCNTEAIIKGKEEYGGGWVCFKKQGGCGAKFKDGDKSIEGQVTGRVENPDIIDTKNTVLKMAKKRAKIDAVIGVTRSSGIFTQDFGEEETPRKAAPTPTTEDIDLSGPAQSGGGSSTKGSVEPGPPPEPPKSAEPESEFIGKGMQANFARTFEAALPKSKKKDADVLRHQWLEKQGYIDKDGNPSSSMIRTEHFAEKRDEAAEWASGR